MLMIALLLSMSYMQTDAVTPKIGGPTMFRVVASVLAVVCKRMQQLTTKLGPAVHRGKDTTHKAMETMCNAHAWVPTMLTELCKRIQHYASPITEEKKCYWLKSLTGFKLCATAFNNTQQRATRCANGRNL